MVSYLGNPLMWTVTESPGLGVVTPTPSATPLPGLTDSE